MRQVRARVLKRELVGYSMPPISPLSGRPASTPVTRRIDMTDGGDVAAKVVKSLVMSIVTGGRIYYHRNKYSYLRVPLTAVEAISFRRRRFVRGLAWTLMAVAIVGAFAWGFYLDANMQGAPELRPIVTAGASGVLVAVVVLIAARDRFPLSGFASRHVTIRAHPAFLASYAPTRNHPAAVAYREAVVAAGGPAPVPGPPPHMVVAAAAAPAVPAPVFPPPVVPAPVVPSPVVPAPVVPAPAPHFAHLPPPPANFVMPVVVSTPVAPPLPPVPPPTAPASRWAPPPT